MNSLDKLAVEDWLAGQLLLVDKPLEWTSFQVVNKIRWALKKRWGLKKIKIGHAGTLDPLASGLLLICVGKWTKRISEFQGMDKEYSGQLQLGATTPSYDLETAIDTTYPTDHISPDKIEAVRKTFLGFQEQFPPLFSAIKKKGVRLYEHARKGETVAVDSRKIHIDTFELDSRTFPVIGFQVRCSKGTYIRSLAYDLGRALESGAHLKSLCRTQIGKYRLDDAYPLDRLINLITLKT